MKKKRVSVVIAITIEYAWICLNEQGSEYTLGLKCVKILNMAKFWTWQGSHNARVTQRSEQARICLNRVLDVSPVLNMSGLWS